MPKLDMHEPPQFGAPSAVTDELLQLAQAAWLDYHRRSAGGEIQAEKHEKGSECAFDRLVVKLTTLMDLGRDDIIADAFTVAHGRGAEDVANELRVASEIAASTYEIEDIGPAGSPRCAYLYAIPVCTFSNKPLQDLTSSPHILDALQESVAGFRLFEGSPEAHMSDRLLSVEEMEMLSYSAVRQITKELASGGDLLVPPGLTAESQLPPAERPPRAHLRYLVFTITQDEEFDEDDEARMDIDDGREGAWLDYVQGLLEQHIANDPGHGAGFMTVGFPDEFYDAHYSGRVERSNAELLAFLRGFSLSVTQGKETFGAVIAPFGENGVASEVRIALIDSSTPEFRGGFRYPLHRAEDMDDALNSCGQVARDFGFEPVRIYAEVQSDEGLAEGQAGFLIHHPTASMLPEVPFPTSSLLH